MGKCEWQPCLKVIGPREYNTSTDEAHVDFKKVSLQIGQWFLVINVPHWQPLPNNVKSVAFVSFLMAWLQKRPYQLWPGLLPSSDTHLNLFLFQQPPIKVGFSQSNIWR